MSQIKIYGDIESSSIFFINSSVDPKPMGTVVASLKSDEDRIVIQRNDRFESDGVTFRTMFTKLNANRVQNREGQGLVGTLNYTTQDVIDYINEQANLSSGSSGGDGTGTDLTDLSMGFKLDSTSTSVMLSNGLEFGVNTIKAFNSGDGLISIVSELGELIHFTKLDHSLVTGHDGLSVSGGLSDVINYLNELFTVGAFTSVVISDPYSTMIADVDGVTTTETGVTYGNAIETGADEYGALTQGYNVAGYKTPETINQAGEYFTFNIRNEAIIGFGLVPSQSDYDNGDYNGNATYADPSSFGNGLNNGGYGYQFSHWFHPSPNGPWTNYGANVSYSMREGWNNATHKFSGSPEGAKWLAGDLVKIKVGINENNFIVISYFDESTSLFIPISRTTYPVPNGLNYHLGVKFGDTTGRLVGLPKVHQLEDLAPTMTFRYIESPDGVFHYPLFTTSEEAEYYDKITNSVESGSSHTHTYDDDPTNTTWYMPEASHDATEYQHSSAPSGSESFNGNAVTYTEVTSVTDSDLTPDAFTGSNITQEEGTSVNIQVSPQDASYSTSVDISPSGSGLVYNGSYLLQGTLSDVGSDTTYTVTVTRANSYGSSVGTFTILSTDVPVASTLLTNWTKAVQMSGSSEYMQQVSTSSHYNPIQMAGYSQTVNAATVGKTSADTDSRAWNTASVFYYDNTKAANIWSCGEGQGLSVGGRDVISLQMYSGKLVFNWGRNGAYNRGTSTQTFASGWYGIYMSHDGARNANGQTVAKLNAMFKFTLVNLVDGSLTDIPMGWGIVGGGRMTRTIENTIRIGRQHADTGVSNASIKTASLVINALSSNATLPTDTEISMMVRDPQQWRADYKIGQNYRKAIDRYDSSNFQVADNQALKGVQIWLMGDNNMDSYSNGIRNTIQNGDQNYTKLQLISLVSNDIETVNINGLN